MEGACVFHASHHSDNLEFCPEREIFQVALNSRDTLSSPCPHVAHDHQVGRLVAYWVNSAASPHLRPGQLTRAPGSSPDALQQDAIADGIGFEL